MSGVADDRPDLPWEPGCYERFEEERSQPFFDLLEGVVPVPGGRVVDLGCGTGKLTRVLHERSRAASTLGIDRSQSMLAEAVPRPGLEFLRQDIAAFEPARPFDLVFSNAALQWLADHPELLARVAAWIAPGGQLAVQLPANHHHPSQTLASRIYVEEFGGRSREASVLRPDDYAVILHRLGLERPRVRLNVYLHELPGREQVLEWVSGTLLNAYRARMTEEDFDRFFTMYRERLLAALPDDRPFPFTFPRILMWAGRPA